MKCPEAQIAIRASIEREIPLDAQTKAHLATCEECSEDCGDWTLDHALRLQAGPLPGDGFVDRVIEFAIRDAAVKRNHRLAMAASIAVVFVVLGFVFAGTRGLTTDAQAVSVTLTAHEGKTVRVLIDSPAEHDGATVTIELADNLELAGFPNEHKIEWQTDLSQGRNLLALPLTLTSAQESHFNVALSYGATRKDVRVAVHPAAAKQIEA